MVHIFSARTDDRTARLAAEISRIAPDVVVGRMARVSLAGAPAAA